jgi:hypothetical protein
MLPWEMVAAWLAGAYARVRGRDSERVMCPAG